MALIASIIVVNWQGEPYLERCLSSLALSARISSIPHELLVVDDASSDKSAQIIAERFPRVRLIRNEKNIGFARSANRGMAAAKGRYGVLCNNDLAVREGFVEALLSPFRAKPRLGGGPLFAVSARTISWYDGTPNQVCMGARWIGGRITPAWKAPQELHPCLFVQAGAAAYDLTLWKRFGGLSQLYEPGYWEDYDLSWRAAKAGFSQLYQPEAVALHHGGGSMTRRFGEEGVRAIKARNHLLFEAANLTSPRLLAEWFARHPLNAFSGEARTFRRAFWSMLPRWRSALRQRLALENRRSDETLFAEYSQFTPSW